MPSRDVRTRGNWPAGPGGVLGRLITNLGMLPGIGPKSAERIALHLLNAESTTALALADAIRDLKSQVRHCGQCHHFTESSLCEICTDPRRDPSLICVVEHSRDLLALERSGVFRGMYHVLLGRLAPLDGQGPERLTVESLLHRLRGHPEAGIPEVREVILATNPTLEGDGTALYVSNLLAAYNVKVTRLARGLAVGLGLEFANREMLADALEGRRDY